MVSIKILTPYGTTVVYAVHRWLKCSYVVHYCT